MKKLFYAALSLVVLVSFAFAQTGKTAAKMLDCTAVLKAKVNINTAKLEEMKCLPGFSDKIAKDVISNRPFKDAADFKKKIEDIGPVLWKKIEAYAKFK